MSEKDTKVEVNPKINIQQADPNLPPSEPKPAATVLLVRTIPVSYTHLTLPTNREV